MPAGMAAGDGGVAGDKDEDNEANDGGERDPSSVARDVYLDPVKNAQTTEEALAALEKLIEVAFKSRRITVAKVDVLGACLIVKDRLGNEWGGGGGAAQFGALLEKFKKGEPEVGRLIGAHVVLRKHNGWLLPGHVTEYAEEGEERKEQDENAGKHKVEFVDGDVEWCMMDIAEHVTFVGEVGRPLGEAMMAANVGVIVALMGALAGEAREGALAGEAREVRDDDADARRVAMMGCVALGHLVLDFKASHPVKVARKVAIGEAGGIAAVIGAMVRCKDDARVQEYGLQALGGLGPDNAENKVAIVAAGGIAAVVGAMGRCRDDTRVQLYGCCVLRDLADENTENKVAIVAAGGIAAVVGAMGRCRDDTGVQLQGINALKSLVEDRDTEGGIHGKEGEKRCSELGSTFTRYI